MIGMILGAVVIYILFFGMCFLGTGSDKKNMRSYYSYPKAVQERIKENEKLNKMIPPKKSLIEVNVPNIILFTIVFTILGLLIHLKDFKSSLIYFLIIGEGLNIFDLIVIDACWWRNTTRIRFKAIPDKALYKSMKKHIGSFIRGIPVFAASAILGACILFLINFVQSIF